MLDKRPIFLKFITPEQQLKSDAIHNLGPQVRQHNSPVSELAPARNIFW